MPASGACQDLCRGLRVILRQPQGSTALSFWGRVFEGQLPTSQRPRPCFCPRGAAVVVVEQSDGDARRVLEFLGSLRLSLPRATVFIGGALYAHANDESRGGRFLVYVLTQQLFLLGVYRLHDRGSHVR